jgi:polyhydroxybutyrate depolymerase
MNRTARSWIGWAARWFACLLIAGAGMAPLGAGTTASAETSCTLAPTNGTVTRSIGPRSYRLRVPAGLTGAPVPLLVSMHGAGATASFQESTTAWSPFADSHDFVVAYPQGVFNLWNVSQGSPDVAFLRQVVDDIADEWCIDPHRLYADGHSNGAYMSQRLACDAADRFAAVVEYAGGSPTQWGGPCTPSRPVGVGLFHGEADPTVPAARGRDSRDQWIARNGCSTTPSLEPVGDGTLERYTGCGAAVEVWWRSYPDQGHGWPAGARGADQRDRMWAFLTAHTLP